MAPPQKLLSAQQQEEEEEEEAEAEEKNGTRSASANLNKTLLQWHWHWRGGSGSTTVHQGWNELSFNNSYSNFYGPGLFPTSFFFLDWDFPYFFLSLLPSLTQLAMSP